MIYFRKKEDTWGHYYTVFIKYNNTYKELTFHEIYLCNNNYYLIARCHNHFGVIDINGKTCIEFIFYNIKYLINNYFTYDFGDLKGIINIKGEIVFPALYKSISKIKESFIVLLGNNKIYLNNDFKSYLLDSNLNVIKEVEKGFIEYAGFNVFIFDSQSYNFKKSLFNPYLPRKGNNTFKINDPFLQGVSTVNFSLENGLINNNELAGIVDNKLNILYSDKSTVIKRYTNNLYLNVRKEGKEYVFGLLNSDGTIILPQLYDGIHFELNGFILFWHKKININSGYLNGFDLSHKFSMSNNEYFVYGILNSSLKNIFAPLFWDFVVFKGKFLAVCFEGTNEYIIINDNGNVTSNRKYNKFKRYNNILAYQYKNKWGFINQETAEEITPPIYSNISVFEPVAMDDKGVCWEINLETGNPIKRVANYDLSRFDQKRKKLQVGNSNIIFIE